MYGAKTGMLARLCGVVHMVYQAGGTMSLAEDLAGAVDLIQLV
jgi:hypothetical protein